MTITISDNAAKQINKIIKSEPVGTMLRVSVEGGGCSGFQYKYDLTQTHNQDDLMLEKDGITVLIDEVSQPFMEGCEIDFVSDIMGASFQIINPNATASCGCGISFSI